MYALLGKPAPENAGAGDPILIVLCPSFLGEKGAYQATAIALASDILGSALATWTYARHKNIDLKRGSVMLVCILAMCTVGSYVAFIVGNVLYYAVGIILAFAFKDNRAFCKYICPITVFLKPMSYFALIRIKCDKSKCISCGKCKRVCPMDVDVTDNSRKRENGTECILCMECTKNCPKKAL